MRGQKNPKDLSGILFWSLAVLSLVAACLVQAPILFDRGAFDGDATPEVYWAQTSRLEENDHDLMAVYSDWLVPPGTKMLYGLGSMVADPVFVAKAIAVTASVLSILLLYLIALSLTKKASAAFLGSICALLSVWFLRERQIFGAGGSEDISILLMMLFVYSFIRRKWSWVSILLISQALFYPPLFLHSALALALWSFWKRSSSKEVLWHKGPARLLIGVALLCLGFLVLRYEVMRPPAIGISVSVEEGREIGELHSRTAIFGDRDTLLTRITNEFTGIGWDAVWMYVLPWLLVLSLGFFNRRYRASIKKGTGEELICFLTAGILLCVTANFVLFKLYHPSRYVQHPLNIFIQFLAVLLLFNLDQWAFFAKRRALRFIIVALYVGGLGAVTIPRFGCHVENYYRPGLIEAVRGLPAGSFIAGHPSQITDVVYLGRKRIFLTYKMSTDVFWRSYHRHMSQRTFDLFAAYFSDSLEEVIRFCDLYGITHLIVSEGHFDPGYWGQRAVYYPPYDKFIDPLLRKRGFFVLKDAPDGWRAWEGEGMYILDVDKMRQEKSIALGPLS